MKKIFETFFTIILILSFLFLPKLSFAEALLTPLNVTENSVTLRAENLTKNTSVTLGIVNKNSATIPYSEYRQANTDNTGKVLIVFTGLSSGEQYVGSAYYTGNNTVVGTATFSTNKGMLIEVRDIKDTSVVILAKNFPPNKEINFNVTNYDYTTPSYTNPQDITTDESGLALFQFQGMSPGGHYRYSHSESSGTGSFYTTGDVMKSSDPGGLVPCGTKANPKACDFNDIMKLINTIINFVLFVIAVPLAAIMFAYAGFMLVTSGGSSEKMSQAKSIFGNVAIGLIIAAAAWLIVHTILNIVGFDGSWIGL